MNGKLALAVMACAAAAVTAGTALAQKSGKGQGKEMTYTGCVEPGKAAGTYMLTHVMMGKPGGESANAGKKGGKAPKSLELESSSSVQLGPQSGHKVTVMGTTMRTKAHMKMMVKSVESVSASCP